MKIKRLWIICALVYVYFVGGYLSNTMTNSIASLTVAMVESHTLIIDEYTQHERDIARYQDHLYSGMPPGLSFMLLPVYLVLKVPLALVPEKWMQALDAKITSGLQEKHPFFRESKKRGAIALLLIAGVLLLAVPLTLAMGVGFKNLLGHVLESKSILGARKAIQGLGENKNIFILGVTAFLMLGTGVADFTATLFHTTVGTVLAWLVFVDFTMKYGQTLTAKNLFFLGCALGMIPTLDYPAVIYPAVLFPFMILAQPVGQRVRACAWIVLGAFLPLGIMAIYHTFAYGKPWITAYHMRIVKLDRHFVDVAAAGTNAGAIQMLWEKFLQLLPGVENFRRTFFDPRCNLPLFNPLLPLGLIAALTHFVQNKNREARIFWGALFGVMILNFTYYVIIPVSLNPSGGSYGARYTLYSVPFALMALVKPLVWIWNRVSRKVFAGILILFSLPAWPYLFYGSPNRPIEEYGRLLLNVGPTNYTLFKAIEGGMIQHPLLFSWGGFLILALLCRWVWVYRGPLFR